MIYTVASVLAKEHGGRTKSLLNRIKLYREELGIEQVILTTNYNANYNSVYNLYKEKEVISTDQKIVNIYDWLSKYNLLKDKKNKVFKRRIKEQDLPIENYYSRSDAEKNCIRYYDIKTDNYLMYRNYYKGTDIAKFDDFFTSGVRHKIERWEYNDSGILHRITNYSRKYNTKLVEKYYDLNGRLYCKKFYDNTPEAKLNMILIYENEVPSFSFSNEKDLFTHFFNAFFLPGDIIFNDARLLDKSLINCKIDIKPILVFHSSHLEGNNTKNSYKLALSNSEKVYKYYLLTNHQKEDIQNVYNIGDEKFAVIPHFIKPSITTRNRKNQFVFMGRFSPEKQIDHIIEIFYKYVEKGYLFNLMLFGGKPGKEREKIEKLIKEYNLEERVTIKEFTNNPSEVFAESRASLVTSKYEGFPLSIMESINEGCPVISYDIRYGPREIIEDNKNGILVEKDNIKEFSEAMMKITDNPLEDVETKENIKYQSAIANFKKLIKD
ncbi:glycosyl transferase family 1 [Staphylococcus felis]|uniref:glycosyltransferase n=1 Tax=Staphylococcus felis TaxID=46127 RepID=UPI000E27A237|nr:glycosyltransferase [Staphylococcus felis]REI04799.1 glycosyl transferase family 1 [Staphylococcus felis]